jgi:hypothetical protein
MLLQLLVTANVVCSVLIHFTLTMEATSETSVLTRATQRHITENSIFQFALFA